MRSLHIGALPPLRVGGCGQAARVNLWVYGFTGLRVYDFTGLRVYGFMGLRVYGLLVGAACLCWRGACRTDLWRQANAPPAATAGLPPTLQ